MPEPRNESLVDLLAALRRVRLFEGVSQEAMRALVIASEDRIFKRGQPIISQGEFGAQLFVLASGRAEVLVRGDLGIDVPVCELAAGETAGEMCVIEGAVRSATVRAKEVTLAHTISATALNKLKHYYPADHARIIENIAQILCVRLRALDAAFAACGGLRPFAATTTK